MHLVDDVCLKTDLCGNRLADIEPGEEVVCAL